MTNPSETELRLRENRARIDFFPDRNKVEKLSLRLIDIAEALEAPDVSRDNLIRILREKRIRRVLDVGIGSGTDTPLTDLARLDMDGEWLFPSQSLVGIDHLRRPKNFEGLYTFQSVNVLNYTDVGSFDIIYAKGVLSSAWDDESSQSWYRQWEAPEIFTRIAGLLSKNENARIILETYIWAEYILLTDKQADQCGFEVVESASMVYQDEQLQKKFVRRGRTGKMYRKLVLRRKDGN